MSKNIRFLECGQGDSTGSATLLVTSQVFKFFRLTPCKTCGILRLLLQKSAASSGLRGNHLVCKWTCCVRFSCVINVYRYRHFTKVLLSFSHRQHQIHVSASQSREQTLPCRACGLLSRPFAKVPQVRLTICFVQALQSKSFHLRWDRFRSLFLPPCPLHKRYSIQRIRLLKLRRFFSRKFPPCNLNYNAE